jgi:hypothetical protein
VEAVMDKECARDDNSDEILLSAYFSPYFSRTISIMVFRFSLRGRSFSGGS